MRILWHGIRIVAFEQAVALPFATFVLAEMGAEVIKLERPRVGDVIRGWDDTLGGMSSGYLWVNGGKLNVTVDLSLPEGKEIVERLVEQADVFCENFAPSVADRFGLGEARLRELNEQLAYLSLSGYGQGGPYRDVKAYDLLVQGEVGILASTGNPDASAKVGTPVADLMGGAHAVMAIVLALYEKRESGRGTYLDVSMLDAVFNWLGYYPHRWWHLKEEPPRTGLRHQFICPYGPFVASDGIYVNLVVANEPDWHRFCKQVVAKPECLDDSRFKDVEARQRNRSILEPVVEEAIASRPHSVWLERLAQARLPHGRVRTIEEVVTHPQLLVREMIVDTDSPAGSIPMVRFPLSPPDRKRWIPSLGQHTEAILKRLGYSERAIDDLRRRGVV